MDNLLSRLASGHCSCYYLYHENPDCPYSEYFVRAPDDFRIFPFIYDYSKKRFVLNEIYWRIHDEYYHNLYNTSEEESFVEKPMVKESLVIEPVVEVSLVPIEEESLFVEPLVEKSLVVEPMVENSFSFANELIRERKIIESLLGDDKEQDYLHVRSINSKFLAEEAEGCGVSSSFSFDFSFYLELSLCAPNLFYVRITVLAIEPYIVLNEMFAGAYDKLLKALNSSDGRRMVKLKTLIN
ncbi:uncharacterized protein LOC110706923 [Chenopodium quinoa]|uniref:uncharacterized protein LOC110706923 n=1 Tax=Chenopodium quinoa TaxID=63459 RepID=UPI000B780B6D|nr:uncharacterized protein LOC110706923 [Chenopodium quinoa]